MSLLTRLLEALDDNLHTDLLELPEQRVSPEHLEQLPPGRQFEVNGYWSHCRCCNAYTPPPCPLIHPGPCDKPRCNTTGAVA